MSSLGSRHDFFVRCIQVAITDILHDTSLKEPGILQYHTKMLAQIAASKGADILSIDLDTTVIHIIKTHQKCDHGRLAGTGRTYDRNHLPRFYLTGEVVDDDLVCIIAKFYMFKRNGSFHLIHDKRIFRLRFFFLFQEFKDTFCRCNGGLQEVGYICHLLDRLGKVLYVLNKCLNVADCDASGYRKHTSHDRHSNITKISHKGHNRLHESGQELRFPCGIVKFFILGVEFCQYICLLIVSLHNTLSGESLFHLSVDLTQSSLLGDKVFL